MKRIIIFPIIIFLSLVSCNKQVMTLYMNEKAFFLIEDNQYYIYSGYIHSYGGLQYSSGDLIIKDSQIVFHDSSYAPLYNIEMSWDDSLSKEFIYIFGVDGWRQGYLMVDSIKYEPKPRLNYYYFHKDSVSKIKLGSDRACWESDLILINDTVNRIDIKENRLWYYGGDFFSLNNSKAILTIDNKIIFQDTLCRKIGGIKDEFYLYGDIEVSNKYKSYSSKEFRNYLFLETYKFRDSLFLDDTLVNSGFFETRNYKKGFRRK